jgi:hypothetical protein
MKSETALRIGIPLMLGGACLLDPDTRKFGFIVLVVAIMAPLIEWAQKITKQNVESDEPDRWA